MYDMYRAYRKNIAVDVPYVRFKRVLDRFNRIVRESILDGSQPFKMPYGLGLICIGKYKPKHYNGKSLSIDYKSSKEEGKIIYHLNEHSNGYKYRLFWSKTPLTFPARYRYEAKLVRLNKRYLALLIFNNQDYIEINDIQVYKM